MGTCLDHYVNNKPNNLNKEVTPMYICICNHFKDCDILWHLSLIYRAPIPELTATEMGLCLSGLNSKTERETNVNGNGRWTCSDGLVFW